MGSQHLGSEAGPYFAIPIDRTCCHTDAQPHLAPSHPSPQAAAPAAEAKAAEEAEVKEESSDGPVEVPEFQAANTDITLD
jgi:hypothetical protein